jgi:hypothetical protein
MATTSSLMKMLIKTINSKTCQKIKYFRFLSLKKHLIKINYYLCSETTSYVE